MLNAGATRMNGTMLNIFKLIHIWDTEEQDTETWARSPEVYPQVSFWCFKQGYTDIGAFVFSHLLPLEDEFEEDEVLERTDVKRPLK